MIHYDGNFEKIIIPKKIKSKITKKYLNFTETITNNYNTVNVMDDLDKNLEVIENTNEELYHGIKEMYDIVILKSVYKDDQSNFFRIYEKFYKNPLVKKVKFSHYFFKNNLDLFKI